MSAVSIQDLFLLDPEVIYLNHGSFGATPKPVFEVYQSWQCELETQPVHFMTNRLMDELETARQSLGKYLHADPRNLAYLPNASHAVNLVARSIPLHPGDEILTSDHEYGACNNVWKFVSNCTGATYRSQPIPIQIQSREEILEQFWEGVKPQTKVIFLSHITSPTALHLPVEEICRRARKAGILTFIDGAHAPGQISINLTLLDPDFYTGNCHKWMLAPKGSAFLYTRPELQPILQPLVISWGWGEDSPFQTGSKYLDNLQWSGTDDYSAYLSVPAAIQFQVDHDWDTVRDNCHHLLQQALIHITQLTGIEPVYSPDSDLYHQMGIAMLPNYLNEDWIKHRLSRQFHIEIPLIRWKEKLFMRISVQGYNTPTDIDVLFNALKVILDDQANH
jgi:isopenicillin-N epimerase